MRSALPTFNEVWQRQFRAGFLKQLSKFGDHTKFLIGCSGGMDSMLLLFLMSEICPQRIRAISINHQLQARSGAWANFVQDYCATLQIPCVIQAVHVAAGNLEHQAREARYQAFQTHIQSDEILVLAHHQQDQAETLMLRLLSGAGIQGLSGMKSLDHRQNFQIWRPLLDMSREQICQWVEQLGLVYIDDPTNQDTYYDRAWCRYELWHILQSRFPKMQEALARTSYLMQDADEILTEVLYQDLNACGDQTRLSLERFKQLTPARQRQLLSLWMKGEQQYRPSFAMVQRIQNEVIEAKPDAQAALHWNQYYFTRYQNQLFRLDAAVYCAEQLNPLPDESFMVFDIGQRLVIPSGEFQVQRQNMGLSNTLLSRPLTLKPRIGGEKIHLHGRVGAWPLKKAIQQAQIFPWMRHTIQILSIDNVMLGVFTPKGFWLAESDYCEVDGWQPELISLL